MATIQSEGISKVWTFFKSSFADRPNPEFGSGLTAFREEWGQLPETDKAQIRSGIADGTLSYVD